MKKKKNNGALPKKLQVADRDYRGREGLIKSEKKVAAPDGISGDWGSRS